jgi:predicted lipoprotein with Yx(FWY)xxD motif
MKKSYLMWVILALVAVVAGVILWISYSQPPVAPNPPSNPSTAKNTPATVPPVNQPIPPVTTNTPAPINAPAPQAVLNTVNDPALGVRLIAVNGHTLYYFTKDMPNVSVCTGVCATNWPAYTVSPNAPLVGVSGVTGKVGTITKPDGSLQVTYNRMPLYFWHLDQNPGDTLGQGIQGTWYVAKP